LSARRHNSELPAKASIATTVSIAMRAPCDALADEASKSDLDIGSAMDEGASL
jgi:hypothetical protein